METPSLSTATTNMKSAAIADIFSNSSMVSFENDAVKETKALLSELCRHFYKLGWVSGTGGSVTIKVHEDNIPKHQQLIVMSPSGVQKERMMPGDNYVLSSDGFILSTPQSKPYPHDPPKCTDCAPLFLKVYEMRNAGAVIHSHGKESCIVTGIHPFAKEFRISQMEMIKGIRGHGYSDELVVLIIENAFHEGGLVQPISNAIRAYPKSNAVLVRNHGVFIWGDTWISAKTQAESYHYLCAAALKLHQLGLDWSAPYKSSIGNPNGLKRLTNKVYIYSSKSIAAQHLLFGKSKYGDLRKFLCGYFDITIGSKNKMQSYTEILLTVGVARPSDMFFITDSLQEALVARAAGLEVIICVRPGNEPLPENHGLRTIESLLESLWLCNFIDIPQFFIMYLNFFRQPKFIANF